VHQLNLSLALSSTTVPASPLRLHCWQASVVCVQAIRRPFCSFELTLRLCLQVKAAKEAEVQAVQAKEVERARRELLALTETKDAELAEKSVSLKQCLERMVGPLLLPPFTKVLMAATSGSGSGGGGVS